MREIQSGLKPIDRARQMVTIAGRGSQSLKPEHPRSKARREDAAELSRVAMLRQALKDCVVIWMWSV